MPSQRPILNSERRLSKDKAQSTKFILHPSAFIRLCTKSENPSHGSVRMLQVLSTNSKQLIKSPARQCGVRSSPTYLYGLGFSRIAENEKKNRERKAVELE